MGECTRSGEAPAERPNTGARCERLLAFLRSSRDRCSAQGRDAAQQELRTPGTAFRQKVKAIRLPPDRLEKWKAVHPDHSDTCNRPPLAGHAS